MKLPCIWLEIVTLIYFLFSTMNFFLINLKNFRIQHFLTCRQSMRRRRKKMNGKHWSSVTWCLAMTNSLFRCSRFRINSQRSRTRSRSWRSRRKSFRWSSISLNSSLVFLTTDELKDVSSSFTFFFFLLWCAFFWGVSGARSARVALANWKQKMLDRLTYLKTFY